MAGVARDVEFVGILALEVSGDCEGIDPCDEDDRDARDDSTVSDALTCPEV